MVEMARDKVPIPMKDLVSFILDDVDYDENDPVWLPPFFFA